jgi:hypothetical protein
MNILTVNLVLSTLVFWAAARMYVLPKLPQLVAALVAVAKNAGPARLLVWSFNVVGTADLVVAITLATIYQAAPFMGPAYWIPAFWVPALLVTHYLTFVVLTERTARWAS